MEADTCTGNWWRPGNMSLPSECPVTPWSLWLLGWRAQRMFSAQAFPHTSKSPASHTPLPTFYRCFISCDSPFHHKVTHANHDGSSLPPVPPGFESHRKYSSRHIVRVFPEKYTWNGKTCPGWRWHHFMGWSQTLCPLKRESYWKTVIRCSPLPAWGSSKAIHATTLLLK